MKKFEYVLKDSYFPQELCGEVYAETVEEATEEILSLYEMELGTSREEFDFKIWERR